MITVSLKEILDAHPCKEGFLRVLHARGKINDETFHEFMENNEIYYVYDLPSDILELADDEQFPAASVVTVKSLDDALWALRVRPEYSNLWRKYAVWCARQVQHLMNDERSITALDVAWGHSDGLATDKELRDAQEAAMVAVRDARGAGFAAARAARDAAWEAAYDAAARAAEWVTGGEVAKAEQAEKLIEILNAGKWVE